MEEIGREVKDALGPILDSQPSHCLRCGRQKNRGGCLFDEGHFLTRTWGIGCVDCIQSRERHILVLRISRGVSA